MVWFGTVFSSGLINSNAIVAAIPMYKHEAQKILNNLCDSSATLQRKHRFRMQTNSTGCDEYILQYIHFLHSAPVASFFTPKKSTKLTVFL